MAELPKALMTARPAQNAWSLLCGFALTLLLFLPPILHFGQGLRGIELPLALLPTLVLLAYRLKPAIWISHFAFPCAHLPLLLVRPEFSGPEVYGGLRGLLALGLVLIAFIVFLMSTTPHRSPSQTAFRFLFLPLIFALTPAAALAVAALSADAAPESAALAILVGPFAALFVIELRPHESRATAVAVLVARSRPRLSILVTTAVLALVAIVGCAFWLLWSPR